MWAAGSRIPQYTSTQHASLPPSTHQHLHPFIHRKKHQLPPIHLYTVRKLPSLPPFIPSSLHPSPTCRCLLFDQLHLPVQPASLRFASLRFGSVVLSPPSNPTFPSWIRWSQQEESARWSAADGSIPAGERRKEWDTGRIKAETPRGVTSSQRRRLASSPSSFPFFCFPPADVEARAFTCPRAAALSLSLTVLALCCCSSSQESTVTSPPEEVLRWCEDGEEDSDQNPSHAARTDCAPATASG